MPRKPAGTSLAKGVRFAPCGWVSGILIAALALTSCPLTDKYYVEKAAVGTGGSAVDTNSAAAGTPTGSGGSAATAGAASGPFGTPTLVTAVSNAGADDDDPTLTADLLELYFNSDRTGGPGNGDIWVSRRASSTSPWGTPTLVSELSTAYEETTPSVSADGLTMHIGSSRTGCVGDSDIWISTRTSRSAAWGTPACVSVINSTQYDCCASLGASQLNLLFLSERSTTGLDLYLASRASTTATWGTPQRLQGVNTSQDEGSACLFQGGLTLVYSTTHIGDLDLYIATRATIDGAFGSAQALTELNSGAEDSDPWVSEDGHHIVFHSRRSGNGEIYEAYR